MEIMIIFFLVLLSMLMLFLVFIISKWIWKKRVRKIWTATALCIILMVLGINNFLFKKMTFIQSSVYPDLYLIRNPLNDEEALRIIIKDKVQVQLNNQFIGKEDNFISDNRLGELEYGIRFYEYTKGWGTNPIGAAGTAHFIENEEDPGGFSSELLEYYLKYRIASFDIKACEEGAEGYFGQLDYFHDGAIIKTDELVNSCEN